jgi:hypothetical protein
VSSGPAEVDEHPLALLRAQHGEPLDGLSGILEDAFEQARELTCEALDRGRLEQASAVAVR